jgi:Mlc titration factor MtfA (ptsG expression regulator)
LRDWLDRRRHGPALADALWRALAVRLPWLARLQHRDPERAARLRALTARFLHEKSITPLQGLTLDAVDRAQLAVLCCLPLLEFGREGLHGWSQVLVYPGAFRAHRKRADAAGVVHEWDDALIGEAWEYGPMVLSWQDVEADRADPHRSYHVAVHEMAHKLDALDGVLDGTPPLPRAWQARWANDFQQAFDALQRQVALHHPPALDPYAAESPEEFFAVASEYHFSDPATLQHAMPAVAAHLDRFYGPSPLLAD